MLRESASAFDYELVVAALRDPTEPVGVPGGNLLLRLVDAVLIDSEPIAGVHSEIIDKLGPEALVDAAAVHGNFEMMNRVADASGIPVPAASIERHSELIGSLEIGAFLRH